MRNVLLSMIVMVLVAAGTSVCVAQGKSNDKKPEKSQAKEKGEEKEKGKPEEREKSEDKAKAEQGKDQKEEKGDKEKAEAREPGRGGREAESSDRDDDKGSKEKAEKSNGQGNAYGRNKGGLSGRDFGQLRSAEARAKMKKELEESDSKLAEKEVQIQNDKSKIDQALEELRRRREEAAKGSTTTKEAETREIDEKVAIIKQTKEKLETAEQEVKAERKSISLTLADLKKIAEEKENQ